MTLSTYFIGMTQTAIRAMLPSPMRNPLVNMIELRLRLTVQAVRNEPRPKKIPPMKMDILSPTTGMTSIAQTVKATPPVTMYTRTTEKMSLKMMGKGLFEGLVQ